MAQVPNGNNIQAPARRGASGFLAAELRGDLRCARCRYNLRGLSVTGPCPECGTPVRVTLLVTVDPMAAELRPVRVPWLTAHGLILWSGAAMLAALVLWWMRIIDLLGQPGWGQVGWLRPAVVAFAAVSGVGALALVAPQAGIPRAARIAAAVGCVLYIPLCILLFRLHFVIDTSGPAPYGLSALPRMDRSIVRVFALAVLAGILLCLRPNARLLAARSFLMRTGRVDRQTMAAMLGVIGMIALGDAIIIGAGGGRAPVQDVMRQVGQLVIMVGSMLLTVGLVGVVVDCIRLRAVILEPPLSLEELLEPSPGGARNATAP